MFMNMLSKRVHKLQSPGDEEADKLPESNQYGSSLENYLFYKQQTDGSCQKNCNTGNNKNVEEKMAITRNEEKNDDWVNPKKGAFYADKWAYILLLLLTLPLAYEAAPIKDHQLRQQDFCGIYQSELSEGSGPWNDSMCSSELKKIQCQQTGQIKHCVPFISRIQDLFAVCINFNLTDDQCILVTQTENGTYKVQCYEGKKDCSTPVSTSPPTSLKSTQDPLTVNITNPQPNSQPDDGVVLSITIPIVLGLIGIGIVIGICVKKRKGTTNQHNRDAENPGDQGQSREQWVEHQTQNGRHLTQNGGQELEHLTQNGEQEVEHLTQNRGQEVEHLTQNGGQGVIEENQP